MSLQFIMGPSGSGKSHYLYEWVTAESLKNPNKNYIVLVPEQFTMQTQKDLVMTSPRKGILNVEVLSFNRLAHRVFEETGDSQKIVLDDPGKNFIIRKVVANCENELKVLGRNLKKPGYISEMNSVISEFTQYDIKPDRLDKLLTGEETNPNLYYKLKDIQIVYQGFQQYLEDRYITGEEVLDLLAAVADGSKILKDSIIVLDGFTGFTPIQNKLLRKLLCVCEKVIVTVTMDKRENPFVYKHPYQLFSLSKQLVTTLIKIADESGIPMEPAVYLYEEMAYRFRENEALGFMESHLFRYLPRHYDKEQDSVQIWCAKNPQEEVDFVAQQIRFLIRTKGYRYKDIAVLANDVPAYANHIERTFDKYELPIFMDHKRSVLLNSFVEYIRSLLAMAEQNFTYESVFRYLRTGLVSLSNDEVDILENYVLALGIRGYSKWQEKWIRRTRDMQETHLAEINRIREVFVSGVQDVMTVLKSRHKTILDITKALHSFFLQEKLQQKITAYQHEFEQQGELAMAKEYAQIYKIVMERFDQFVELLGDEKVSLREYCELLDAGLEQTKVGIIPPSIDQVVVGDVERSRIKDVKVVFLLGVNDIYIPGNSKKYGLLSEYDRGQMTDRGMTLAPGTKEKTYIQKFYLYLALTKPSEQVYLTYSKTSAEGNALRPSYLLADIMKLFPGLHTREISHVMSEQELTANSGLECLVRGLQKKQEGLSAQWQQLYTWYKNNPVWKDKIEQLVAAAFYHEEDAGLSEEMARKIYGELLHGSVTRMEQFAACAYAHFLRYGIRLKEREIYQFRAVDIGNLFHGAIERFSRKLETAGFSWNCIPEDRQEQLIGESIEECIVDYGNSILYSSARNEYMISRLKRMLRRTVWALGKQLDKGDFVPAGYEIVFAGGKIDRVDICEDKEKLYVKIVDYKTGEKAFDLGEFCYGLQIQLVVYMNAALEIQARQHPDKQVLPAGIFYYRIKDPIVDKPDTDQSVEEMILRELRPDGIVQGSPEVLYHFDKEFSGASTVIPVTKKQNGEISKTSKVLTEEEFRLVSQFANQKLQHTRNLILSGETKPSPYMLAGSTACDYCPYHAVCGFDEKISGFAYRNLDKVDSAQALEKIRKEVQRWE